MIIKWLRSRSDRKAERLAHDDEDPRCRYWWGDRSGMNMRARCKVCSP